MTHYRIDAVRSTVLIDASSSVHPIHTEAAGLEGWLDLDAEPPRGHVEFRVDRLTSGNVLEDRELRRRVDTRRHPLITGDLTSVEPAEGASRHLVTGDLTFHGVRRTYTDVMTIEHDDSGALIILRGESTFDIRDFGMEPPRILMLRVHPEVRVRVEIVAREE